MTRRISAAMRAMCERRASARDVACAWLVAILIGIGTFGISYAIESVRNYAGAAQVHATHDSGPHRAS